MWLCLSIWLSMTWSSTKHTTKANCFLISMAQSKSRQMHTHTHTHVNTCRRTPQPPLPPLLFLMYPHLRIPLLYFLKKGWKMTIHDPQRCVLGPPVDVTLVPSNIFQHTHPPSHTYYRFAWGVGMKWISTFSQLHVGSHLTKSSTKHPWNSQTTC